MHRIDPSTLSALRPLAFALALGAAAVAPAHAAKYTYHGELMDGETPAEGTYDLRVRALAEPDATKALAEPTELPGVRLSAGRFSVELDLPEDADGITWMDVAVRASDSGAAFETLGEPQPLSKGVASCPGAWALDGNSGVPPGSFVGPVDADALLELRANGRRVARLDSAADPGYVDAPTVVFGASSNAAPGIGNTISGGGATHDGDTSNPGVAPLNANRANGDFSTIGGGIGNAIDADYGVVSGGMRNSVTSNTAAVGGGGGNRASGHGTTVAGGDSNIASGTTSTVGGGDRNQADGQSSTIAGGFFNCAGGDYSWAGGRDAKVRTGNGAGDGTCAPDSGDSDGDQGSFVWADSSRALFTPFVSTGPNQFAIRAAGGLRWEGTGVNSTRSPAFTHRVDRAASGGNTCTGGTGVLDSRTAIDHPLLNGNPNAVIVMTPNYGSTVDGVAPPRHPMGVYFNAGADGNCAAGRWVIYDVTTSAETLNDGAMFNVWFVLP